MDGKNYKYYRSRGYRILLKTNKDKQFCYVFRQGEWMVVNQMDLENEENFEAISEEELALMVLNNEV